MAELLMNDDGSLLLTDGGELTTCEDDCCDDEDEDVVCEGCCDEGPSDEASFTFSNFNMSAGGVNVTCLRDALEDQTLVASYTADTVGSCNVGYTACKNWVFGNVGSGDVDCSTDGGSLEDWVRITMTMCCDPDPPESANWYVAGNVRIWTGGFFSPIDLAILGSTQSPVGGDCARTFNLELFYVGGRLCDLEIVI